MFFRASLLPNRSSLVLEAAVKVYNNQQHRMLHLDQVQSRFKDPASAAHTRSLTPLIIAGL